MFIKITPIANKKKACEVQVYKQFLLLDLYTSGPNFDEMLLLETELPDELMQGGSSSWEQQMVTNKPPAQGPGPGQQQQNQQQQMYNQMNGGEESIVPASVLQRQQQQVTFDYSFNYKITNLKLTYLATSTATACAPLAARTKESDGGKSTFKPIDEES